MAQTDNPFDVTDWAALQRRYLDALQTLGFPGSPGSVPGSNPWQSALDYWWQGASATLPAEQRSLFAELVRQSGAFLACAEFFTPLTAVLARQPAGGPDWEHEVRRQFEALQQQLAAGKVPPGMESLLGAWKLPDDMWQQTSALFARRPEELLRPIPGAASMGRNPAFGADALREGARLWQEYQQALSEYLRMLSTAACNALDRLRDQLLGGAQVPSLRALYDLWVDCGETSFSEMMAGVEFAGGFARLVNALSSFKLHTRQMIDAGLEAMHLPTAQALGTMQRREAGMRSELRAAQTRQQEDRETLLRLQRELETLRPAAPHAAPAQPGDAET
jgi:class III poly(R)-hydroxyalkanoic acid synthase PhaE subunit